MYFITIWYNYNLCETIYITSVSTGTICTKRRVLDKPFQLKCNFIPRARICVEPFHELVAVLILTSQSETELKGFTYIASNLVPYNGAQDGVVKCATLFSGYTYRYWSHRPFWEQS